MSASDLLADEAADRADFKKAVLLHLEYQSTMLNMIARGWPNEEWIQHHRDKLCGSLAELPSIPRMTP